MELSLDFRMNSAAASLLASSRILNDVGDSGQDYEGRLWDLLMVFRAEARKTKGDTIYFTVLFLTPEGKMQEEKLWAKCGPGDNIEPVITIMLVGED